MKILQSKSSPAANWQESSGQREEDEDGIKELVIIDGDAAKQALASGDSARKHRQKDDLFDGVGTGHRCRGL